MKRVPGWLVVAVLLFCIVAILLGMRVFSTATGGPTEGGEAHSSFLFNDGTVQVEMDYVPEYAEAFAFLNDTKIMQDIAHVLNTRLKEPPELVLKVESCGEPNAFYSPKRKAVILCYELIMDTVSMYEDTEYDLAEILNHTTYFIVMHEIGHALVDAYTIPITGREEDAVDQLAILFFAENDMDEALVASAMFFRARSEQKEKAIFANTMNYWDEHSFDEQRYYNILCWAYGQNESKYEGAITKGGLPEQRAKNCAWEYYQMHRSWTTLLEPHVVRS